MRAGTRWKLGLVLVVPAVAVGLMILPSSSNRGCDPSLPHKKAPWWRTSYRYLDEIKFRTEDWKDHTADLAGAKQITVDFMKNQFTNMGFAEKDQVEVVKLIDARMDFNKEKRVLNTNPGVTMSAFYIVFKNNQDADKFLDLRKQGMSSYPQTTQEKIRSTVNFARKKNFVGIFVSEDLTLREHYPREKWGFGDTQMNLGQF